MTFLAAFADQELAIIVSDTRVTRSDNTTADEVTKILEMPSGWIAGTGSLSLVQRTFYYLQCNQTVQFETLDSFLELVLQSVRIQEIENDIPLDFLETSFIAVWDADLTFKVQTFSFDPRRCAERGLHLYCAWPKDLADSNVITEKRVLESSLNNFRRDWNSKPAYILRALATTFQAVNRKATSVGPFMDVRIMARSRNGAVRRVRFKDASSAIGGYPDYKVQGLIKDA